MEQQGHLSRPAEIETALERADGAGAVALIELEGPEAEEWEKQRVDVPRRLRDVYRLAETPEHLGEPRIQGTDIVLPTTDGREVRLRCVVGPEARLSIA